MRQGVQVGAATSDPGHSLESQTSGTVSDRLHPNRVTPPRAWRRPAAQRGHAPKARAQRGLLTKRANFYRQGSVRRIGETHYRPSCHRVTPSAHRRTRANGDNGTSLRLRPSTCKGAAWPSLEAWSCATGLSVVVDTKGTAAFASTTCGTPAPLSCLRRTCRRESRWRSSGTRSLP